MFRKRLRHNSALLAALRGAEFPPVVMSDFFPSLLIVVMGVVLLVVGTTRLSDKERPWIWMGFVAHIVAAVGQVLITENYYGGGDMTGYYLRGKLMANLVRVDFFRYLPDVLMVAAKQVPHLPVPIFGLGSATGAISGYSALALLLTADSYYAACIVFALAAFVGQFAIYKTVREVMPAQYRVRSLIAIFLIPSVAFWSSGILKESLALAGLGLAFRGLHRIFVARSRAILYVPMTLLGLFLLYSVKAYVLFPLLLAIGAWTYLSRVDQEAKLTSMLRHPFYFALVTVAVLGGLYVLGRAFPEYSPTDFSDETARLQGLYYNQVRGNSTFRFESETPTSERQVYLAPLGLLSTVLRPLPFEVHNATSLLEAMSMLVFNILLLRLIAMPSNRRRAVWILKRSPFMVCLLVFVVVFGTGVGLATPNLGSLSRYRIPMMPFYALLLAGLLPLKKRR